MVEIFSDEFLRKSLAFRGGTALHKLYLKPQARYSEDIDLVQINPEPINLILKKIRDNLMFLGTKRTIKQHIYNNTIIYRFETEVQPIINMRLKIEINTREHYNILGLEEILFKVKNSWFSEECNITCYKVEELLGTKLRALFQRKKGRDLFDLFWALEKLHIDSDHVISCYQAYMKNSGFKPPSKKEFTLNIEEKLKDEEFATDIFTILRNSIKYDVAEAWNLIQDKLMAKL